MKFLHSLSLAFSPIDIADDEFDGFLSALVTGASVFLLLAIVAAVLIAFDQYDRWRSPVEQARRKHFGGV